MYSFYKKKELNIFKLMMISFSIFLCTIIIFVTGVMFYCNVTLVCYPISQSSMQPLLNPNGVDEDSVYITKDISNIDYGDVIVYSHGGKNVIKRVIALQNDNITVKKNDNDEYRIFIQYGGQGEFIELEEDYIQEKAKSSMYSSAYNKFITPNENKTFIDAGEFVYLHIDNGCMFCVGDNRYVSIDSFTYGQQSLSNTVGEVVYIIHGNNFKIWQVLMQFLGFTKWK